MKLRWKVSIGMVAVGILLALALPRRESGEQRALEQTRRDLRAQGFKIDLAEFDFSTPDEFRARITALTNATTDNLPRSTKDSARHSFLRQVGPELMKPLARDAAVTLWRQAQWPLDAATAYSLQFSDFPKDDLWPLLRQDLAGDGARLNAACVAVLSGPVRVPLDARHGGSMLLPHLSTWKNLTHTLGSRALVELHDGNPGAAWTNALAATRLVTAWEIEPVEVSHLVRAACADLALSITWQTLQTNGWSDEQLGQFQREWESVDFFKALPETAAFARACGAGSFQREREEPMESSGPTLKDFFRAPKQAWASFSYWYQRLRYRRHGSYEDEKDILLYYRDWEQQLRQAVQAGTWNEMQQLPGVTNNTPFTSKHQYSKTSSLLNIRQLMLGVQGQGQGFLGRVAEAEARRRLIIAAIALERFHTRHDAYPKSLEQLSPDLVKNPPVDFMDGRPLRYRLTGDGHFVLYSVGLDCVDNGGETRRSRREELALGEPPSFGSQREVDIIWPRPASPAELEAHHREQVTAQAEQIRRDEEQRADYQWSWTAERQAQVVGVLAARPAARLTEPMYRGRPLAEKIGNPSALGTNSFELSDLLTLKQIITGTEPEIVTFDVPIAYDALTNFGMLALLVDPIKDEDFVNDCRAGWLEGRRATNGNCQLAWNTIYESPGPHALQLRLVWKDAKNEDGNSFAGPLSPFVVSNVCQFSLSSAYFKPEFGATLRALVVESNASYSLEITSPTGEPMKTITGSTSNGLMTIHWDLVDDHGRRRTNSSFNTVVHLKLLDSGRSQTLKGP